jgi:RNA polymerase-binding transcription factor DksA
MRREGTPGAIPEDEARARLEEERARLEGLHGSITEQTSAAQDDGSTIGELSAVDQHPADVGTETFERSKDVSILQQVERQLRDVDRAITRLDAGEYGGCEACGKPIDPRRLEARPATRFCIDDQQRAEREATVP